MRNKIDMAIQSFLVDKFLKCFDVFPVSTNHGAHIRLVVLNDMREGLQETFGTLVVSRAWVLIIQPA